ncbi:hypothetical protein Metal_2772 [Methylomicrobium album BG8]|uniref:Uncharacterized protein n=1 Tax=Methylomicrobium album BG8 TaxID=686340 RepID=H8GKH3_METAL|nr:hypothetical protein [Methylomicrobium agile]EIC30464.1 hypothetical protein Metal_2772 [Methylomicrobium album BG8]
MCGQTEVEQLGFQEAARRADELDQGETVRVPADEVDREARSLLK